MRWAPRNGEAVRADRIQRTLKEKTLQLAGYKKAGATTILVMESDDTALTNCVVVGKAIQAEMPPPTEQLPLIDEVYLAETPIEPWTLYVLKRGNVFWPSSVKCPPEYYEFPRSQLVDHALR